MIENGQGQIVPFAFPARQLRMRAASRRKQGRPVDAVELERRAAETTDATSAWLALAEGLYGLGCYEQACMLVFRMLARRDVPPDAWLLLARGQIALGHIQEASDSLCHCLSEEPFGAAADTARGLLSDLRAREERSESVRTPGLVRRGLLAIRAGQQELGLRRLRRALLLTTDPSRIHLTIAMAENVCGNTTGAAVELARALKRRPDDPKAMTALCVAMEATGRRRFARGLLLKCEQLCGDTANEGRFLRTARLLEDSGAQVRYIEKRMKRQPCRIALLHTLAQCRAEAGLTEEAGRLWQRILRIDPADMRARISLEWVKSHPETAFPDQAVLMAGVVRPRLIYLAHQCAGQQAKELLAQGSETRMLVDWVLQMDDPRLQRAVVTAVSREDDPAVTAFLREVLTCPSADQTVREQALLRLEELGVTGEVPMLHEGRMVTARSTVHDKRRSRWARFLRTLLEEMNDPAMAEPLVWYAADEWGMMTRRQHDCAAGRDAYSYAKAIEILFLRETGQEEAAMDVLRRMDTTPRRIERVLRGLAPHHELLKGEE